MDGGGNGDLDLGVGDAAQTGRVCCRHVELMQRRQQIRPRHVELAGVAIDAKDRGFVATADAVGDLTEGTGVEVGRYQPQDRLVPGVVVSQGHVVPARLENRPVVVHVRHLDAHDRYCAQSTCETKIFRTYIK